MLIGTVIVALEGIEAIGQINPKLWWIIPFQRRIVKAKLVVFIIGEAGKFLRRLSVVTLALASSHHISPLAF